MQSGTSELSCTAVRLIVRVQFACALTMQVMLRRDRTSVERNRVVLYSAVCREAGLVYRHLFEHVHFETPTFTFTEMLAAGAGTKSCVDSGVGLYRGQTESFACCMRSLEVRAR